MCNREVVADALISWFFYILDIKSVIVEVYFDSITRATGDTKKARFSRPHRLSDKLFFHLFIS